MTTLRTYWTPLDHPTDLWDTLYTNFVSNYGAKGLAYIKVNEVEKGVDGLQSPILKFLKPQTVENIIKSLDVSTDDLIFFGAGKESVVNLSMSSLIKKLGEDLDLYTKKWAPCWVVNFPMFEINNEGNLTGYKNDIVWTFIELYAMELIDNINNEELEEEEEIKL